MNTQFSNLLSNHPNQLTMSSLDIAELTGKRHDNVLRDIDTMLAALSSEMKAGFKSSTYLDGSGKPNRLVVMDKDSTICLVSGYDANARMSIIKRWQEFEQNNSFNIPTTFAGALALAAKMAEENEKLGVTVKGQTVTIHRQAGTIHQQAEVIDHKRIVTDESDEYLSVARVRNMNPNQRYSGALLGRISDKLDILVIPQHAAKGQIPVNTYHKSVWELAYPEASLFD